MIRDFVLKFSPLDPANVILITKIQKSRVLNKSTKNFGKLSHLIFKVKAQIQGT